MQLERGQVAVITGGASGIGRAMALAFADRGIDVVVADLSAERLAATVAAIEDRGVAAEAVTTDVRIAEHVDALAARALTRFGRIDIVCNNAGVVTSGNTMWETPQDEWNWVLAVNLMGVIHGLRAFVPHLVAQNRGHVVNTASIAGLVAQAGTGPYLASKHGVVALSEGLALELAAAGVDVGVTVVCPGVVDTDILSSGRDAPAEIAIGDIFRQLAERDDPALRPTGVLTAPEEVAAQILQAIESNRLHVAPAEVAPDVRARFERLLGDIGDSSPIA